MKLRIPDRADSSISAGSRAGPALAMTGRTAGKPEIMERPRSGIDVRSLSMRGIPAIEKSGGFARIFLPSEWPVEERVPVGAPAEQQSKSLDSPDAIADG